MSSAAIFAQNLDRLSLSSGGASTNEVSYVLGEIFNFTVASDGNIVIETGSLGSEGNTGGITDAVKQFAETETSIKCYPNPADHLLTVDFGDTENVSGVVVLNDLGQVLLQTKPNGTKAFLNVQGLASGCYYVATLNGKKIIGINKIVKK